MNLTLANDSLPRRYFWPAVVLIILVALFLRVNKLMFWPIWWDEGLHIMRAHAVAAGRFFTGLDRNKWLYMPVVAIFNPTGPEGPFIARYVTTLFGVLSTAGCVALGTHLDSRRTGLLAGVLYAIVPMAVFHERQAILDPMVGSLGILATVMSVALVRRQRWWLAVLLGVLLAAGRLTKLTGIVYFGVPVMALVMFTPRGRVLKSAAYTLAAFATAGAIIWGTFQAAEVSGLTLLNEYQVDFDNTSLGTGLELSTLQDDIDEYSQILSKYLVLVVPALAVGSLLWVVRGKAAAAEHEQSQKWQTFIEDLIPVSVRWEVVFLLVMAFIFALVPILADRPASQGRLAPRYLMPTAAPMIVLAAVSLIILVKWLHRVARSQTVALAAGAVIVASAAVPSLQFWYGLQTDFLAPNFVTSDRRVYTSPVNLNFGIREASEVLVDVWEQSGSEQPVGILVTGPEQFVAAYAGSRIADVAYITRRDFEPQRLPVWITEDVPVFVIEDDQWVMNPPLSEINHTMDLVQEADYGPRLFLLTGASDRLANKIHNEFVTDPEWMQPDYEALAASLAAGGGPVYIFPSEQVAGLQPLAEREVVPLEINHWPITDDAVADALFLNGVTTQDTVDLILVDETRSDPQRHILLTMLEDMYHLSDTYYGLLHHIQYVSGPENPEYAEINGVFEDAMTLQSIAIIDAEATPGQPVRTAVKWSTNQPIEDSFSVFLHVRDGEGNIVAQADSIPGNGLLPMTAWEPDQTITDRFTIKLPPDIQPGTYEVVMGVYEPVSGLRLHVTQSPGDAPDYIPVGQISVTQ